MPAALETAASEVVSGYNRLTRIDNVPLPVMEEQAPAERRETRLFERGNMLTKTGVALTPGMPKSFPQIEAGKPADRLAMARAFFAPDEPLTARVAVNRFWEQLFGIGLVETLEDFGSAGVPPSHPQLLDWLAVRFQNDLHWDTKALLRELVLSATYRQDAHSHARVAREGSAQSPARPRPAPAADSGDGARPGAGGERSALAEDGRPAGDAAAARRRVAGGLQQGATGSTPPGRTAIAARVYTFIRRSAVIRAS